MLLFLVLVPLPLVDEIVGKRQFEKLCSENGTIHMDRSKVAGKTVYLAAVPDTQIKGAWIPVVLKPWRFVDADSGEVLVSYNTLMAVGGMWTRTLRISEGNVPLTFKGYCEPGGTVDLVKLFKEAGITQIQRSALGQRGKNDSDPSERQAGSDHRNTRIRHDNAP